MDDRRILLELEDEVQSKNWYFAPGRGKEKSSALSEIGA